MKNRLLIMVFCVLSLSSCNNDQESGGKSGIGGHTEKMAKEAVQTMKAPLDQAKAAAEKANDHNKQMEYQLKTQ